MTGVIYELGHHPKNLSTVITDFVHQVIVQQTFAALKLLLFVCLHEMQSSAWDHSSLPVSHTDFLASFCTWIYHGKNKIVDNYLGWRKPVMPHELSFKGENYTVDN